MKVWRSKQWDAESLAHNVERLTKYNMCCSADLFYKTINYSVKTSKPGGHWQGFFSWVKISLGGHEFFKALANAPHSPTFSPKRFSVSVSNCWALKYLHKQNCGSDLSVSTSTSLKSSPLTGSVCFTLCSVIYWFYSYLFPFLQILMFRISYSTHNNE